MKNNKTNRILILIMIVSLLFGLSGCAGDTDKNGESAEGNVVFKYGEYEVTLSEVYVYALTMSQGYIEKYGSQVWDSLLPSESGEMISIEYMVKEDVVEAIVRILTINSKAEAYGIKLTSVEKEQITAEATEFYNNLTDKEIEEMGLSVEVIEKVLSDNKLAALVYNKMMENANIEVSSEEARMTTFYDMFFPCYKKDSEGNVSPFTEAQKENQHATALVVYGELLTAELGEKEITGIDEFAQEYNLDESSTYTMSPTEIKEIYGERVCNTIYSLYDGSYSIIVESDYGFHVFYMEALTDENATNERKLQMEAKLKEEKFQELYSTWRKGIDKDFAYPDSVNMELMNTIKFK